MTSAAAILHAALAAACQGDLATAETIAAAFPDSRVVERRVTDFRGQPGRARHALRLKDGSELRLTRLFPLGRLRRVSLELHLAGQGGKLKPAMAVAADGACAVIEGRRLSYDADGQVQSLDILDASLSGVTASEALNPPVPEGRDPGGVLVALVDTGVNYRLDAVVARLARDAGGALIGHDFWDDDARPFDADTGRSPFFPLHHGTAVASVLLREAPTVRLAPYRFPRPAMARMADVVAHANAAGARIVNMAMGSSTRADWDGFAQAAAARPHMLFVVSAGNDGRDIDARPVYPAALDLDNLLTVTSADAFGRLAEGSNWGRITVDVMAPGENVAVTDHRGVAGKASGSSFAVPRIA
ncbi:MAG: S8 family serine peptidase, partial [Rhodospirillaceae bacterium]